MAERKPWTRHWSAPVAKREKAERPTEVHQIEPGEWVSPVRRGYFLECCNCGTVHRINFRLVRWRNGRRIQFQMFRAEAENDDS